MDFNSSDWSLFVRILVCGEKWPDLIKEFNNIAIKKDKNEEFKVLMWAAKKYDAAHGESDVKDRKANFERFLGALSCAGGLERVPKWKLYLEDAKDFQPLINILKDNPKELDHFLESDEFKHFRPAIGISANLKGIIHEKLCDCPRGVLVHYNGVDLVFPRNKNKGKTMLFTSGKTSAETKIRKGMKKDTHWSGVTIKSIGKQLVFDDSVKKWEYKDPMYVTLSFTEDAAKHFANVVKDAVYKYTSKSALLENVPSGMRETFNDKCKQLETSWKMSVSEHIELADEKVISGFHTLWEHFAEKKKQPSVNELGSTPGRAIEVSESDNDGDENMGGIS